MSKFAGFQKVKLKRPQRSTFDLSHQKRLSTRMGRLTPVFISEAIPGDSFFVSSEVLLRLAPLLAPIYDSIQLFVHFFFVPYRLLWAEWTNFITGGREGTEVPPIPPYVDIGEVLAVTPPHPFSKSSLSDYLGVPLFDDIATPASAYDGTTLSILPHLAYLQVYMDYYRDRNYVSDEFLTAESLPVSSGDKTADFIAEYYVIRTRSYLHDYFTSALPWTQRGDEVLMPLAGTGTVTYLNQSIFADTAGDPVVPPVGEKYLPAFGNAVDRSGLTFHQVGQAEPNYHGDGQVQNIDEVHLDASSVSINDFRTAYALQVWLERNAVAGSRYTESIQAHFGVRDPDGRLQRAEYIGGGRIPVKISEVVSTAYSSDGEATVPLANMAGHGVTYGNTNQAKYFCPEHGFVIGIMSIMNPPSYHQGLPRMFKRKTFLDYPWPTFAKLGEQEVKRYELYASPANLTEDEAGEEPLFGYQSRYADWKFIANSNHGDFHDTLLFWTLTREFESSPVLGQSFVEFDDQTQDRIFAVNGDADNFWCYVHNRVTVKRALPYFGTPNTLGFG